ncbi:uncharacterized protein TERG_12351 [Trichophyton rubrum CBS 118892]|uniref:Uncharacterized protein n=1 Tax=Trichophyton rubrum (strain ATCC MYA-4607 / CBS 118892) TaxID=559305 RepID=A0A080WMS2_TRIRC|nr:uncharacterized protein TERG_12351 [Trichophyton rubrum CBS 118892]KFL62117.1 hypothetical protein TERG_12351 [Trichophyton rubrum CBS 118892]
MLEADADDVVEFALMRAQHGQHAGEAVGGVDQHCVRVEADAEGCQADSPWLTQEHGDDVIVDSDLIVVIWQDRQH